MLNVLVCCIERGPGPGPRDMESLRGFKTFYGTKREEISWVFVSRGGSWGRGPGRGAGGLVGVAGAGDLQWTLNGI